MQLLLGWGVSGHYARKSCKGGWREGLQKENSARVRRLRESAGAKIYTRLADSCTTLRPICKLISR